MMDMGGGQQAMGGGQDGGQGGQMVPCPCCGGQGQVPPEVADQVMQKMQPEPDQDDTAQKLAAAMGPPRRG